MSSKIFAVTNRFVAPNLCVKIKKSGNTLAITLTPQNNASVTSKVLYSTTLAKSNTVTLTLFRELSLEEEIKLVISYIGKYVIFASSSYVAKTVADKDETFTLYTLTPLPEPNKHPYYRNPTPSTTYSPTITSITPSTGLPGDPLHIDGTEITPNSDLIFTPEFGIQGRPVTYATSLTTMDTYSPKNVYGNISLQLEDFNTKTKSMPTLYGFYVGLVPSEAPVTTSISPQTGNINTQSLVITGSNFIDNVCCVLFYYYMKTGEFSSIQFYFTPPGNNS